MVRPAWSVETADRRFLRLIGCFPAEFVAVFASGRSALPCFPEVRGKIGNLRAQPDFRQQNRRPRKRKTGVWSVDLGFTSHFRILLVSERIFNGSYRFWLHSFSAMVYLMRASSLLP